MTSPKLIERAFAQSGNTGGTVPLPNPLNTTDLVNVVGNIANWF